MQVMLEAGEDFLTIKESVGEDGKPDMLLTMDRWGIPLTVSPLCSGFTELAPDFRRFLISWPCS